MLPCKMDLEARWELIGSLKSEKVRSEMYKNENIAACGYCAPRSLGPQDCTTAQIQPSSVCVQFFSVAFLVKFWCYSEI